MNVKRDKWVKIPSVIIFIIGILYAWGGMIFALGNSQVFHPSGLIVAIIGYCLVPGAIYGYEISTENNADNVR